MLRVERRPGVLIVVSRLARPRVLFVLAAALGGLAVALVRPAPAAALGTAVAAALIVLLGGRTVQARLERGRVSVRHAVPFRRREDHAIAAFVGARVETFAEARRHRAERLARAYRTRSGTDMPAWLRRPDAPGANDHLRRIVLVSREGEPLAVTAWLADDDLEPARLALEELSGPGLP